MVRKTPEEIARKQLRGTARGALITFLEGRQNINWFVGEVEYSGVRGQELAKLFDTWKDYGGQDRYQKALEVCREKGWLD